MGVQGALCPEFSGLAEGGVFLGKAVQREKRAWVLPGVVRALGGALQGKLQIRCPSPMVRPLLPVTHLGLSFRLGFSWQLARSCPRAVNMITGLSN